MRTHSNGENDASRRYVGGYACRCYPACAGRALIHVAVLRHVVNRAGITDDDRDQMGRYLSKPYLQRSPGDLLPDDDEEDEE